MLYTVLSNNCSVVLNKNKSWVVLCVVMLNLFFNFFLFLLPLDLLHLWRPMIPLHSSIKFITVNNWDKWYLSFCICHVSPNKAIFFYSCCFKWQKFIAFKANEYLMCVGGHVWKCRYIHITVYMWRSRGIFGELLLAVYVVLSKPFLFFCCYALYSRRAGQQISRHSPISTFSVTIWGLGLQT